MKKNRRVIKKYISLSLISLMLAIATVSFYLIYNENNEISSLSCNGNRSATKVKEDINLMFEGKLLNGISSIYNESNRLYIPVSQIVNLNGGSVEVKANNAKINMNNEIIDIDLSNGFYYTNSNKYKMKKDANIIDNILYVNLFDFTKMFDLKTSWNTDNKTISLFYNREKLVKKPISNFNKTALIRLEDISAGQRYDNAEALEKLRIISEYLYSENVPFHVAWAPRYVDPMKNIDNNLTNNLNMYNADFIFTLDYFVDKNGLIGLHGYTHQYGDEVSLEGTEFSRTRNISKKAVRKRVEMAIDTAKQLNIPVYFFESPHYAARFRQKKVIGEYFDYLYEGVKTWKETSVTEKKFKNKTVKFVPTPFNYVNGKTDMKNMISKIRNSPEDCLGSFFYHPAIEFEFIQVKKDKAGYPYYIYSEKSVLHELLKIFSEKKYKFKPINSL